MYWPTAVAYNTVTKQPQSLFTYEGYISIDEAKGVIDKWKQAQNIKILCAYVKDNDLDQIVYLENNINALGQIEYKKNNSDSKTVSM